MKIFVLIYMYMCTSFNSKRMNIIAQWSLNTDKGREKSDRWTRHVDYPKSGVVVTSLFNMLLHISDKCHAIRFCSYYHVLCIHNIYIFRIEPQKWHSLWKIIINKCERNVCNMSIFVWVQVYNNGIHGNIIFAESEYGISN